MCSVFIARLFMYWLNIFILLQAHSFILHKLREIISYIATENIQNFRYLEQNMLHAGDNIIKFLSKYDMSVYFI